MEDNNIQMEDLLGMQNVFVDTFKHNLDPKKRLTIPSEWRALVGTPERLFVLPSTNDPCLCVYPAREMARKLQKLRDVSLVDEANQNFMRTLSSRANLVPWDAQGRIRIKDDLLSYAELKDEVMLVGVFTRFELWSPEQWQLKQPELSRQRLGEAARSIGL
ncbi:MAG TPA: division/cell wall cluster transcriptional repressor MraZ [Kiritimatiellia bacterium]|nr:division/cell wall cluster transcriptional repressor MraZ [Kiritimatiellia bacterium]